MKNKYLLISPAFPPPLIGGSKVWTYNMVENSPVSFDILTSKLKPGQNEIVSERHNVIRSKYLWDSDGGNPTKFDLLISYSYIIYFVILKYFTHDYNVIVAGVFDFANGFLFLLGKILGIPVIGLGNAEEFTLSMHGSTFKYKIKKRWMYISQKWASGFIVVCDYCGDLLREIGVNNHPIYIVPSCIDPKKINVIRKEKERGFNIISVGRIVERKGFHDLINAVYLLKQDIPEIKLTVVGDGPFKPVLDALVEKNKMHSYVNLAGKVTDKELSDMYNNSDLFVLAHRMLSNGDTEGCPTVFSEAGAHGIPLIGGNDAGASTAIIDGINGFLVDSTNIQLLADKIKQILLDSDLAIMMGESAIIKVNKDHMPEVAGNRFYNAINKITEHYYDSRSLK